MTRIDLAHVDTTDRTDGWTLEWSDELGTHVYVPAAGGGGGGDTLIDDVELTGDAANIEFTGIPDSYRHLRVEAVLRATRSFATAQARVRVGSGIFDDGTNAYAYHLRRRGGTESDNSSTYFYASHFTLPAANSDADAWGTLTLDLFDYTDTSRWRNIRSRVTSITDGQARFADSDGAWRDTTDAIERLRIYPQDGNWQGGSRARLYGIA